MQRSAPARWKALAIFIGIVALTGGASRADVLSLLILRPVAALFLVWAILDLSREDWKRAFVPLLVLGSLLIWLALQLVPLPPGLWSGMDGRQQIAQLDTSVFGSAVSRPLTLSPAATLNSLFSLLVPGAALLLYLRMRGDRFRALVAMLAAVGIASSLLAIAQSGTDGGLQFYRIASPVPAGLFSNGNHQGVYCALCVLWVALLARQRLIGTDRLVNWTAAAAASCILAGAVVMTGSRAALASLVVCGLLAAFIFFLDFRPQERRKAAVSRRIMLIVAGILAALLAFGVYLASAGFNVPALRMLTEGDTLGDLRFQVLPTILEMARTYFPWGSGFGSFANVYMMYEPEYLVSNKYLNNAHNDVLQLVLEGGLPAIAIFGFALVAAVVGIARLAKAREWPLVIALGGTLALVIGFSFVDYPLRTPIFSLAALALFGSLTAKTPAAGDPGLHSPAKAL